MDFTEYRVKGKEMVDYIADYLENIRERRVFPDVVPGFLRGQIPDKAPEDGEDWDSIFEDVERVIMPGVVHWQSPYMHAYYPALNSFPSLLGDMLANGMNLLAFTWASSPVCTELEMIVMDWLGKMIGLPPAFLHSTEGSWGGGVIQNTTSDSTLVSLLAARNEAIKRGQKMFPELTEADILSRLVAYCSDQAHSSVGKGGRISLVKMRLLPTDDNLSLQAATFVKAIEQDRNDGLIPFYLCVSLGTTGSCAFDNLKELGPICEEEFMWLHIDAAYAGTAFVCPEYRHFLEGIEYADSIVFNPVKWMMVNCDCSTLWVTDSRTLHRAFVEDPLYLEHEYTGEAIDFMNWQVPLSRRFRALKLWFVIRSFGVKGLQKHVRKGARLAKLFESFVAAEEMFEIPAKRRLGLVVFRLKGENDLTEELLKRLNNTGQVYFVPACIKDKYVIRFVVTSQYTTEADIERDWVIIRENAKSLLGLNQLEKERVFSSRIKIPMLPICDRVKIDSNPMSRLAGTVPMLPQGEQKKDFSLSLFVSNVPMTPKIINGSFNALFDIQDVKFGFARGKESRGISSSGRPNRLPPPKISLVDKDAEPLRRPNVAKTAEHQHHNIDVIVCHNCGSVVKRE